MERSAQPTQQLNRWLRIEFALLAYACWQARSLAEAWLYSPFDRLGWLAFLFWLTPWWWPWRGRIHWSRDAEPASNRRSFRAVLMISGFGLAFLGDLGSVNVACHAGLALVLASMSPSRTRLVFWGASAVAWMPALGWFGSRLALDPASLNALRIAVAVLGAMCARHGMLRVAAFVRTRLDSERLAESQPRSDERSYGPSKASTLPHQ